MANDVCTSEIKFQSVGTSHLFIPMWETEFLPRDHADSKKGLTWVRYDDVAEVRAGWGKDETERKLAERERSKNFVTVVTKSGSRGFVFRHTEYDEGHAREHGAYLALSGSLSPAPIGSYLVWLPCAKEEDLGFVSNLIPITHVIWNDGRVAGGVTYEGFQGIVGYSSHKQNFCSVYMPTCQVRSQDLDEEFAGVIYGPWYSYEGKDPRHAAVKLYNQVKKALS